MQVSRDYVISRGVLRVYIYILCVHVIQGSDFPQICSDELLENKQCQKKSLRLNVTFYSAASTLAKYSSNLST